MLVMIIQVWAGATAGQEQQQQQLPPTQVKYHSISIGSLLQCCDLIGPVTSHVSNIRHDTEVLPHLLTFRRFFK